MEFSRRRLFGAAATLAAGMALPRSLASEDALAAPFEALPLNLTRSSLAQDRFSGILLPQARAALDRHGARIPHRDMIGLVDFSAPSRAARFYLVDMPAGQIISTHLVAHGKGSDPANSGWVERFSNRPGSNASCQGAFLTSAGYVGEHGASRRLEGLDAGNNMALSRSIVIHGADYVDAGMAATQGRIGRSQGCFAVSRSEIADVLELLGQGRLLYAVK